MQEILWWWPNLIYFHDVFMNMFRKKWPYLLGRGWCFSPSCNSSSPKPNKKLRFLTSGGCKDEKKVVGPTIFYGASRKFLGKMKPILDEDFSSGWPDSSYYVVEGQFSRGLDRGSFPHKSRGKGP